ncbi:MAG: DUF4258 domain-containing protein [Thermodesulfobacteriota bacterium]
MLLQYSRDLVYFPPCRSDTQVLWPATNSGAGRTVEVTSPSSVSASGRRPRPARCRRLPADDRPDLAAGQEEQALADGIRVAVHGHREMVAEDISYEAVREALRDCTVLENYPDHQRGPCCLMGGRTASGRFLHVVCTTTLEVIVIIPSRRARTSRVRGSGCRRLAETWTSTNSSSGRTRGGLVFSSRLVLS